MSYVKAPIHAACRINKPVMDIEQLTEQVKVLALETGRFLREQRRTFERGRVEKKAAHDYVSYVDKASEQRLVSRLHEWLPQAGFIAEEGSGAHGDEELCWLVDPLDGTTNFIHDNAPYCISIALRNREETLLGVVYECCRDELFWATKGGKAYLNGKEIHVSSVDNPDDAFIALGFPYNAEVYRPFALSLVEQLYGRVGGLRLQGAAAAELCYVAAGRFEVRIEALLGPWDIAAGALILKQAGGRVTDFEGAENYGDARYVLASNGKLHDYFVEKTKGTKF